MKPHQLKTLTYRSTRRGQVAILTSLALVFTLALAGLAVDVGELWNTRRQMQSAADAAATAAVNDLAVQDTTDWSTDALNAAAANGFTNGGTTKISGSKVTVTPQNPPASGTYSGNNGAVMVTIAQDQPTQFLKIAGFNTIPVKVTATALTSTGGACIYTLDPSGSGAFTVWGSSNITSACGVYVDSTSSSAAQIGGAATLTASMLGVVGGTSISGAAVAPVTTNIPAFGDPLSYITAPAVSSCSSYKLTSLTGTTTVSSTQYCGGVSIGAKANITFSPGLYIINGGGISFGANSTTTGNGVTFYLTGASSGKGAKSYGGVSMTGGPTVQLSAPSSASCAGGVGVTTSSVGSSIEGVLFFQDRSIPTGAASSTFLGTSTSYYNGALYFPTTQLYFSGNSGTGGYAYLVGYDVQTTGNSSIGNNYSCLNGGQSIIQNASLVM